MTTANVSLLELEYAAQSTAIIQPFEEKRGIINTMYSEQNWRDLETIWGYLVVKQDLPEMADAAIIGGEGLLTDGATRTAELYHQGVISVIVASGHSSSPLDGVTTEAELLRDALIKRGVPQVAIIEEPNATNTAENITFSRKLLYDEGFTPEEIILVHKPYMTRRFIATAAPNWPEPRPSFYTTSIQTTMRDYITYEDTTCGREGRMVTAMLGDYARIKEYPSRGWTTKQDIPDEVELAYQRLLEDSITGRPIKPETIS